MKYSTSALLMLGGISALKASAKVIEEERALMGSRLNKTRSRYLKHRKKKVRPANMVNTSSTIQTRKYVGGVTTSIEFGNRMKYPSPSPTIQGSGEFDIFTNSHKYRSDPPSISANPTAFPSAKPSAAPSRDPSARPSVSPTSHPSAAPSAVPSFTPSARPSNKPSKTPSVSPTMKPSSSPSVDPTSNPSHGPTNVPTASPSACTPFIETFQCTTSDCTILRDLFISTNGCDWRVKTNWLMDDDYCSWQGITCTIMYGVEEITEINLSNNNLVGTIPDTIGGLFYVSQIVLSTNSLYGDIPSNLGNLVNLSVLNLMHNSYDNNSNPTTGVIPQEICDIRSSNGGSLEVLSADCDGTNPFVDCETNGGCCTYCTDNNPSSIPTLIPSVTSSPSTKAPSEGLPSAKPSPSCSSTPPTSFSCDDYNLKTTCLQLVDFYEATNGCEWTYGAATEGSLSRKLFNTDEWFSGTPDTNSMDPFCSWYGVSCENHDCEVACDVTKIDLPFNNLRGTLPRTMFLFPELVSLELNGNYLSGTIPTEFSWFNKLQVLVLDGNLLTGAYNRGTPGICDLVDGNILNLFYADCDDNYEVECDCCTSCGDNLAPSEFPSPVPTSLPSYTPSISMMPSDSPTQTPSVTPSMLPTLIPSETPTNSPSLQPSDWPSSLPTSTPSSLPSVYPSFLPSQNPTATPTAKPSSSPSMSPSVSSLPTQVPSRGPTYDPTSYCYEPADYRCSNNDASTSFPLGVLLNCPQNQTDEECNVTSCGSGVPPPSEICCVCKGLRVEGNIYPSALPSNNPSATPSNSPVV